MFGHAAALIPIMRAAESGKPSSGMRRSQAPYAAARAPSRGGGADGNVAHPEPKAGKPGSVDRIGMMITVHTVIDTTLPM